MRAELELSLQITLAAFARDGRDPLRAVLGERRDGVVRPDPGMPLLEATRDYAHRVAIEIQRAGDAQGIRRYRLALRVVRDIGWYPPVYGHGRAATHALTELCAE